MAVEARHLNLFRPQILGNHQGLMLNSDEINGAQTAYGVVAPLSGITTATEAALPVYCSTAADDFPAKMKSENWLASAAASVSRKRSRESIEPILLSSFPNQSANNRCSSTGKFQFLGEDITLQIHQQRMEMDRFISQHAEKVRMEMEERQRRFSRRMAAAVKENILKTVKAKEDELEKIGKLNWALEERVKSLSMENQIWKDLAQTNEAKANALRSDLEQVLVAQAQEDERHHQPDDGESCCGSNSSEDEEGDKNLNRMCRSCGKEESCVLLLPCRHLCLCTICASSSSLHSCPVCNSFRTATLHVNLS